MQTAEWMDEATGWPCRSELVEAAAIWRCDVGIPEEHPWFGLPENWPVAGVRLSHLFPECDQIVWAENHPRSGSNPRGFFWFGFNWEAPDDVTGLLSKDEIELGFADVKRRCALFAGRLAEVMRPTKPSKSSSATR